MTNISQNNGCNLVECFKNHNHFGHLSDNQPNNNEKPIGWKPGDLGEPKPDPFPINWGEKAQHDWIF